MDKSDLGDRMKGYENIPRIHLTPRMPIIIRCDGKAFSSFTRGFEKPFDGRLQSAMECAAKALLKEVQGAEMAYVQSDEISVVLNTYKTFATQQYFGGNVQKIASVSASIVTAEFNKIINRPYYDSSNWEHVESAYFDARCFVVPREEVCNYFLWRQLDAICNSVSGYAQSKFSTKQLYKKSVKDMRQMLLDDGLDFDNDVPIYNQRGVCVIRETEVVGTQTRTVINFDYNIPLFSEDRDYVNSRITQEQE